MFKHPKTYQKIDIDYFEDMFETSEPIQLPFMSQTRPTANAATANNNPSTGDLKVGIRDASKRVAFYEGSQPSQLGVSASNTSPEESIEEFAEFSEPRPTTDKVIQIFRKFATSGQMSKTEYQIVK